MFGLILAQTNKPRSVKWALGQHSDNFIECLPGKKFRKEDGSVPEQHPIHVYREVILTLSAPKQWVLDACCGTGAFLCELFKTEIYIIKMVSVATFIYLNVSTVLV